MNKPKRIRDIFVKKALPTLVGMPKMYVYQVEYKTRKTITEEMLHQVGRDTDMGRTFLKEMLQELIERIRYAQKDLNEMEW